jgi:hypothetical protein
MIAAGIFKDGVLNWDLLTKDGDLILTVEKKFTG